MRWVCVRRSFDLAKAVLPPCKMENKGYLIYGGVVEMKWGNSHERPLSDTRHCANDGNVLCYQHPTGLNVALYSVDLFKVSPVTLEWTPNSSPRFFTIQFPLSFQTHIFSQRLHQPPGVSSNTLFQKPTLISANQKNDFFSSSQVLGHFPWTFSQRHSFDTFYFRLYLFIATAY